MVKAYKHLLKKINKHYTSTLQHTIQHTIAQKLLCSRWRNRLSQQTGEVWEFGVLREPEWVSLGWS